MAWVKLDVRFPYHPKVAHLSDQAFRMYIGALCYSKEFLTDGQITKDDIRVFWSNTGRFPSGIISELVGKRLWNVTHNGWEIHDFLRHNYSKEQVLEVRRLRSVSGGKGAASRWHNHA